MKNKIKSIFLVAIALSLNSCSGASSNSNSETKEVIVASNDNNNAKSNLNANTQVELDKAKKDKKVVFLVVTGNGVNAENAVKIANEANKLEKQSVVLQMDRDSKENAAIVSKFGLTGAPLPLILVVATNGLPSGGLKADEATADKLVKIIPTKKQADVLMAASQKKTIFIVASKKTFTDKTKVIENCKAASKQIKSKCEIIEIDIDDKTEAKFLKKLHIKNDAKETVTIIINSQGETVARYDGVTETKNLVSSATTVSSGGCCSGGGSCGPKK